MQNLSLDRYVIDVLMPDLVGHDRRPATFIVYLYLLRCAATAKRDTLSISLQTIAVAAAATGMTVSDQARIFRFTLRHSIVLTTAIGLEVLLYAYVVGAH